MKIILNSLLAVAIIGYVISIGVTRDPFLFVIFFPMAILTVILFCTINCILNRKHSKNLSIIFGCLIFFFISGWAINKYCLPHKFHPISLLGDLGIVIFTVFLGWNFKKSSKKKILGVGTILFILFIGSLTVVGSIKKVPSQPFSIKALRSLPYLKHVVEENSLDKSGVVTYNQNMCNPGINIYHSPFFAGAYLIDMSGKRLHTWLPKKSPSAWHHVGICKDGDLLVSIKDLSLMRLDWDSNIKWVKNIRSHHDIAIAENDDIYALARKDELVYISGFPVPILNDYVIVLSPDGTTKKEISLFDILIREIPVNRIPSIYERLINPIYLWVAIKGKMQNRFVLNNDTPFDILHNNTITIINRNINGLCKKGDILISVRQLDLVGIVDIEQERLLWRWGPGNLDRPHHPTLLENGNFMIFDNGMNRGYSRAIELNPLTNQVAWEYKANPPSSFFSSHGGAAQRMPNGNTLITESNKGYVFEITKDREIVWEFYNPDRDNDGNRLIIYRMIRITDPENYPKLKSILPSTK